MKILICVAGMPQGAPTIRFGGLIARLTQSDVTILTVADHRVKQNDAQVIVDEAQQILSDLPIQTKIKQGTAAKEIIRESRKQKHDLIIMGERNGGLTDLFLSPVVRKVVAKACIPVLVVKRERPALGRILICTGGRKIAQPVIEMGARLARKSGAQVTLLHVASPLPSMYIGLATMEEDLSELLQTDTPVARHLREGAAILNKHGLTAQLELRHGLAGPEILREAQQGDYDLIVMGSWLKGGPLKGLVWGDVTRQVLDNAGRPVLMVCSVAHKSTRNAPAASRS